MALDIQYEERALKLYSDLSHGTSHWLEKEFYIQLGNGERGHMLILKDIEAYYQDPVHWFSVEERSHSDGA